MQMESCYFINGDLELASEQDLQPLVDALVQGGMDCLTLHQEGGLWHGRLELFAEEGNYSEPRQLVAHLLAILAELPEPVLPLWQGCLRKEMDLGYQSGTAPILQNRLPASLLLGLAEQGLDLVVTLYPGEVQA
ncbi:hypothetical protein GNZ06_01100 [Aeromonas jandaei]|uniref:hypothetical protein n=1 Tax=Aeromonas jandaei TaxID=650 RepID=UPI001933BFED|nr:hypothetical protein [Aeromonas jandaei]MBM0489910.1 hypothetical protein [Aeromonas jandaei]MBM0567406.1 hypothetical protein [Aeromonas jandaei]